MATSTARTLRPVRRGRLLVVLAVFGPGLLAGLSDDDPAGITTYSVLGAEYGYELLWVLLLSTAALVVFHHLAARMGVVTGQGLIGLVRQRHGVRPAAAACSSPTSRPGSRPGRSGTRRSAASSCRRCRPRTARS